ncbi:phosphoribosyltransferase [Siccirubricoccus deserti]
MMFRNREDAGQRLATRLLEWRAARPVVFALPRGGVPVACPIAAALEAPLDLLLVRKIGAPGQPELALGAVVEGEPPQTVVNEEAIRMCGVPADFVTAQAARELPEIARRRRLWLHGRPAIPPYGCTAILVDDGIATGATVRAALLALQRAGAARRILAAPVAPPDVADRLRQECDEAVILAEPFHFGSVGAFYEDFRQLEDAEVTALLDAAGVGRSR